MSTRLLLRPFGYILAAMALARQQATTGNTYVVNSTADTSDGDVTDGVCLDLNLKCTLRAAILQANYSSGSQTIILPAGVYTLTRSGYDDTGLQGDLDILDNLMIQGAGSGMTIVDGNGAVINDRVFQIINNATGTVSVSLSGMTIRNGGAISTNASLTLSDVRIEGNTAFQGGGISQYFQTITLKNTIVANSTSGTNCNVTGSQTSITSNGYNLSSDGTCVPYFNQTGDLNGVNPNLGPLANNGGPTLTHMPQPPSPAIDAVPNGTNGCGTTLTTDQRGAPRPINGKCDIGAVEYGAKLFGLYLPLILR